MNPIFASGVFTCMLLHLTGYNSLARHAAHMHPGASLLLLERRVLAMFDAENCIFETQLMRLPGMDDALHASRVTGIWRSVADKLS